ncbi:TPA: hypothetical protein OUB92_002602 [Morganella morganii]|nr:hypothetical protein [Morganella morganii]HCT9046580.1 hypothetical protein [Morganella morganii]
MNNTAVPASPAAVWQTLLAYLLQQHYGLTEPSHSITATDILRARKATGLITHHCSYATSRPVTV